MTLSRLTAALVLATMFSVALTAAPTAEGARRNPVQDTVDDALAYATSDRAMAIRLLEQAVADKPSPRDLPTLQVHLAEQLRLSGRDFEARPIFALLADGSGKGNQSAAGALGLALVDARANMTIEQIRTLDRLTERGTLGTQNADRYLVLTLDAARRNDASRVATYSKKAVSFASEDPDVLARVTDQLTQLAAAGPGEVPDTSKDPLTEAWLAWEAGEPERARRLIERVLAKPAEGDDIALQQRSAGYLKRQLDANTSINPGHIVVLLPLEGKYAAAAKQVRQAFEFGYKRAGGTAKLAFVDSGATAESAVAALEKAVIDDGAVAIVGPLLSEETVPVVEAATALRVPLLSLSQSLEDGYADNVFSGMLTVDAQVQALAAYAITTRGMKSFAIFAPDNPYGQRATLAFSRAVEALGGKIAATATYDADANDLGPAAKQLARVDPKARWSELQKLKGEAKARGGNPDTVLLPPVVDFDAIFLPDNASRVPLATAALAYNEFPMGDFKPHGRRDVLPMLGLSGWNNANLVTRGGPYVRRSLFTDVFLPGSSQDKSFSDEYRESTNRSPTPLEALTADAGRLLGAAARQRHPTRSAFIEALAAATTTAAATGAKRFDPESRRAAHSVRLLTITETEIEQVYPDAKAGPG